ncbi:hypothetical protein RhiXN_11147 [Rhizoctonia solani]|uniref:Uncharacterized protein n=1 Tax=Rhizoctonia solani TaxID=456999 RepID=A0A8H8P7P6_9AGAM|nr:uncharacterized protein RhiXN_11147 [Rhizoctonia solani]QRW26070.1 hypothetical protein RhiXN_11147 [Rhizoctonia solani]
MAVVPTGLTIEIPQQATAKQGGPFFGVHCGVVNGVYNSDDWTYIHTLLKSSVARKFVDPVFARFALWNAAVWFRETGIRLNDDAAAQLGELPCPPRQILSGEIFSALYPRGTTIIYNDNDVILPYTGREPRLSHVLMIPRANFSDNENDDALSHTCDDNNELNPFLSGTGVAPEAPSQSNTTASKLAGTIPNAAPPSATSAHEIRSHPSARGRAAATRRISQVSPPPPTIATAHSRPPSPQPSTWVSRGDDDRWVFHRSTYVASPTIAMSSPERSPECSLPDNQPSGSQQYTSSQTSICSSLQLTGSQESTSQSQIVSREARHRMRILSNMRNRDPSVESQVCTEVILHLLASSDFTAEGLAEIMNAVADQVSAV